MLLNLVLTALENELLYLFGFVLVLLRVLLNHAQDILAFPSLLRLGRRPFQSLVLLVHVLKPYIDDTVFSPQRVNSGLTVGLILGEGVLCLVQLLLAISQLFLRKLLLSLGYSELVLALFESQGHECLAADASDAYSLRLRQLLDEIVLHNLNN